nr:unnamed protein product [Digitaria exilis]
MPQFDSFVLPPSGKKGVKPVQSPGPFFAGMEPRVAVLFNHSEATIDKSNVTIKPRLAKELVESDELCRKRQEVWTLPAKYVTDEDTPPWVNETQQTTFIKCDSLARDMNLRHVQRNWGA